MAPLVLVFAVSTGLYRYVPSSHPAWREAAIGGIALTLLWEAAKHLFSLYLQTLSICSLMYGAFLVMVLFLLWVYCSAALLFGAALVHRLQQRRA